MIAPALLLALAMAQEPVTYAIEATLDDEAHVLRASERIEFRNLTGPEITRLYLHLYPNAFRDARTAYARDVARLPWFSNPLDWIPWGSRRGFMTIHSVRIGGEAARFSVDETVLEVLLAQPLAPGEALRIEIAFDFQIPVLQRAIGYRGASYAMGVWFPKLAVPDTGAWRGEEPPTEEQFYTDCGSYDVSLTLPADLVVAATGALTLSAANRDGTTTRRWRAEQVRYFAWVADRRFRVGRFTWNHVAVQYLHVDGDQRSRDQESLERGMETIRAALDFFSARYGPYPHGTLVVAETPALGSGVGGVAFSQLILLPAGMRRSLVLSPLYDGVLAHEIAHQWWGMAVGTREGQDGWLTEGLAEFAARDLERTRQEKSTYLTFRRSEYLNQAASGFDQRILQADADFGDHGARQVAVYAKASFVLDMLQYLVGRYTLDAVLRAYAERHRNGTARTADFVALAESVSGQDLGWFFDQWLEGSGVCDYAVEGVATARSGAGFRSVITLSRQGAIVMPVDVEITLEDGTVSRHRWSGRERSHEIVLDAGARVRSAVVDPERRVLETRAFNNYHPRRVRSSFLPRIAEDEAYHVVHVPWVAYDDGVELGVLLAGGRAPRLIPPDWARIEHFGVVGAGYNLAAREPTLRLAYSSSLGLLGRRAGWGANARWSPGVQAASVSARAQWGPHFYRAPFHSVGVSLGHERRSESSPDFDRGTVRSVEIGYSFRGLVTDFYPIAGGVAALGVEAGARELGSDWTFLRAAGRAELYQRLIGGTKLAVNLFAGTVAAGTAPRQKALWLSREGNFRAAPFDTVWGSHLTAINGELRVPLGTGTLVSVAAFGSIARYWGSGPEAGPGLRREYGVGLRLFDNSSYGVQLDVPFTGSFDFGKLSLRVGRPFRGP